MADDQQMNEEEMEAEPLTIDEEAEALKIPFASIGVTASPGIWGPCGPCAEQFKDMPYQPFAKSDRLGKAADITGTAYRGRNNRYQSMFGAGDAYGYYHEEDESSFNLVNSQKKAIGMFQKKRWQNRTSRRDLHRARDDRRLAGLGMQPLSRQSKMRDRDRAREERKWQRRWAGKSRWNQKAEARDREASVDVKATWQILEELELTKLGKLSVQVKAPEDVLKCGTMEYYEKAYDRVTVKQERPLTASNRVFHTVTTTDDPNIRELSKSDADANVFATDAILATIMASPRSVYSWDIVIEKIGDKIFMDKRDNSSFDFLTVNETASEVPQESGDSIDGPEKLAYESTYVNRMFSQQVLLKKKKAPVYAFDNTNPFADDDDEVASVGYRYRKWDLGDDIKLVARTEHDAVYNDREGRTGFMNIKALNSWRSDPSMDWRQKLDSQRGAVLATELKNNANKLAKWTICALLAGSSQIRFGYVARQSATDSKAHTILGTQAFKPKEFATQINLSLVNGWGILRHILDIVRKYENGKYVLLKDPNKPVLRIYSVPAGTFDDDEESGSSDDDSDDDDADDN